ncbi:hypothetical protein HPB51_017171 [Rhipicephalus microplus]|uniref:Uncharacterized protein n=1 Tax=Rhipicephalus microplus TaxID=6941 RepID=A0A9J6EAR9_RHIMP|nr:hypothetical protein HPB51_017171 [Rhipicephalus microplus]
MFLSPRLLLRRADKTSGRDDGNVVSSLIAVPHTPSIRRLVEAGLVDYWWIRATGDVSRCGGSSSSSGPEQTASTLAFADVFGVFVLWIACAGISSVVFLAELCVLRADDMHKKKLAAGAAARARRGRRVLRLQKSSMVSL